MESNITNNAEPAEQPALEMSDRRRWAVTIGVMTGMFIAALEATVVGTAMPTVIATLGGISHYSWVFSAYLVTSTVTVPVWGKLSDLYGRRLLYQIGIGVFLLGTLLSGLSNSMTELIIFRAIQGLGAGALVPLGMTIIGDIFTLHERARMQAYFSGVWGLSSVVGPVVGGFITDQISWRWVFFVNLPVGIIAALIIGLSLKEPKGRPNPTIDYGGAVSLMLAISLLMLAMVEGGSSIATLFSVENLAIFAGGFALLGVFIWVELRDSRSNHSISAVSKPDDRGRGKRRISRRHCDVRRDIVHSTLRTRRSGNVGNRSRIAADTVNAQLGHYVRCRRQTASACRLSRCRDHGVYCAYFGICTAGNFPNGNAAAPGSIWI